MNIVKVKTGGAIKTLKVLLFTVLVTTVIYAQNWQRTPTPNDTLTSAKINSNQSVLFQLYAPKAAEVKLNSSDIPGMNGGKSMVKQENGVWEINIDKVAPGAYRYNFNVDDVTIQDPKNKMSSESNMNTWSLFYMPGAEFMDRQRIPHGAVAEVYYYSTFLKKQRRLHVYTPPGYEAGDETYPIFYLLHGAMDSDDSWSTVGRAGFIIDNLIAAGKAKPMVVVMPDGHTGPFAMRNGTSSFDEFTNDFNVDIKPMIEKNYRVSTKRQDTAIAGLSMGGYQTINIAFPDLKEYAYIGVYSSGIFGINGGFNQQQGPSWEEQHKDELDNADLKDGLKLVWFATGVDDFLVETSQGTVDMLKKHNFDVVYKESAGGHTWPNWRDYLHEFAPMLFQ